MIILFIASSSRRFRLTRTPLSSDPAIAESRVSTRESADARAWSCGVGHARASARTHRSLVIAIREHRPGPVDHTVDRARDAHAEPLDPAHQGRPALGLGDQVRVIALHREVHDAHAEAIGRRADRAHHAREGPPRSQAPDVPPHLQRHEHRLASRQRRAPRMRHAGARTDRLAPGARAPSAPPPRNRAADIVGVDRRTPGT
ncbi:MAG: hypothetical protein M3Y87_10195 [Myxococcota bacterium]|nr:hypothetical protein [Myxococcota bacterium]